MRLTLEEANRTLAQALTDCRADFQGRVINISDFYDAEFRKGNDTLRKRIAYEWLEDCGPGSPSVGMDRLVEHVGREFN